MQSLGEGRAQLSSAHGAVPPSLPLQPLMVRRLEHEKRRKEIKEQWHRAQRKLVSDWGCVPKNSVTPPPRVLGTLPLSSSVGGLCCAGGPSRSCSPPCWAPSSPWLSLAARGGGEPAQGQADVHAAQRGARQGQVHGRESRGGAAEHDQQHHHQNPGQEEAAGRGSQEQGRELTALKGPPCSCCPPILRNARMHRVQGLLLFSSPLSCSYPLLSQLPGRRGHGHVSHLCGRCKHAETGAGGHQGERPAADP